MAELNYNYKMSKGQQIIVLLYLIISSLGLTWSFYNVKVKENVFGKTGLFNIFGAFVVGDMIVFGVFWVIAATVSFLLNDWILFLLIISSFWLIRSLGETIYWFNQQFSKVINNPPEKFFHYKFFKSDAVWWINQIFWQCITVVALIFTIYLAKIWF